jgi:hypothetical protein
MLENFETAIYSKIFCFMLNTSQQVNTRRNLRIRRTDDRLDMTGRSQNSRENSDRINERSDEKNGTTSPGAIPGDGNDDSDGSHNSDDSEDDSSTSGNNGAIFDYVGDGSGRSHKP